MESEATKQLLHDNNLNVTNFIHWSKTTPAFTTFRVNTCFTSVDNVIELIDQQMKAQAYRCNVEHVPQVSQDVLLKDCVVLANWDTAKQESPDLQDEKEHQVVVDMCCGVAILRGAHIYAPGVLAITPRTKVGDKVNVYADISKKCLRGSIKRYQDPHRVFLGRGVVHMDRQTLFQSINKSLTGIAVEMIDTVSGVPSVSFPGDMGLLQNYPSILCCHVLNPSESDVLLDMCASPGNKATHLAALMNGKGQIIAIDKTKSKIRRIEGNVSRQHLGNVKAFVYDSTRLVAAAEGDGDGNVLRGPPFGRRSFDRILLDAPCSAMGQRPQLAPLTLSHHNLATYPVVQRKLFAQAVELLKEGGVLVYSTCTLALKENEQMVAWVLKQFSHMKLVSADPIVASPGDANCGLSIEQCKMVQKFGPGSFNSDNVAMSHQTDTIGFFIAKFVKCKESLCY